MPKIIDRPYSNTSPLTDAGRDIRSKEIVIDKSTEIKIRKKRKSEGTNSIELEEPTQAQLIEI